MKHRHVFSHLTYLKKIDQDTLMGQNLNFQKHWPTEAGLSGACVRGPWYGPRRRRDTIGARKLLRGCCQTYNSMRVWRRSGAGPEGQCVQPVWGFNNMPFGRWSLISLSLQQGWAQSSLLRTSDVKLTVCGFQVQVEKRTMVSPCLLFWITDHGGHQPPSHEAATAAPWRGPRGREPRPPNNSCVREPSWKQTVQPVRPSEDGSPGWHLVCDLTRTLSHTMRPNHPRHPGPGNCEREDACCSKPLAFGVLCVQKQVIHISVSSFKRCSLLRYNFMCRKWNKIVL